jgi:DNA-directed RNA polymerase specialized sigma24 family protein
MRRILIDNARRKRALRHGGQMDRADIADVDLPLPMPDDELLALDAALDRLTAFNVRAAELVKLCYFVGLTQEQAARGVGRVGQHGGAVVGVCPHVSLPRDRK